MGKMWTRSLFVPTRRLFPKFSELQLWDEGVVMIIRESPFRDGVGATQARSTS